MGASGSWLRTGEVRPSSALSLGVQHPEAAGPSNAGHDAEFQEEMSAKGIDDRLLQRISGQLGLEWEQLATILDFKAAEVSHFKTNHPGNMKSQIFSMLITWRQKQLSSVDQTTKLHRALTEVGRVDLAEELMDVYSGPSTSFSLEYCQQQVIQHYKDTVSTMPAHPLDPTVIVGTDEYFIHMNLNKKLYQGRPAFKQRREAIGGQIPLHDERVEPLRTWEDLFKLEVVGSLKVLLFGGAGAGKSTMLVKVANSCIAPGPESPLHKFKLVFLLKLRQMLGTCCVLDAIFDQILPKHTQLTKPKLRQIIIDNEPEIAFLLDGLDEIPSGVLKSKEGTFQIQDIIHNKTLVKCCVLLTTRPHMVDYVLRGYPNYARVETKGFTPENRDKYIGSHFAGSSSAGTLLISSLENRESLQTFSLTPIITQMLCIVWKTRGALPEKITDLYIAFAEVLVSRRCKNMQDVSRLMELVLDGLGRIALDGILGAQGERLIFSAEEIDDENVLMHSLQFGFLQEESFTVEFKVRRAITFLHKSFQEFCAARYLSIMAKGRGKRKFRRQLETISSDNVGKVENLLQFCSGTSVRAAGLILKHVNKMRGDQRRLQRLARLLLFESGSGELVSKLDCPTKVECKSHEDLMALRYYMKHVKQPLNETEIQVYCYSIVDIWLLREILQSVNTHSVKSVRVYHFLSAQGKEELQLLEETLRSVGGRYGYRLRLLLNIQPKSWFDAEYVAGSLTRMSQQNHHHLGLDLAGRLPSEVFKVTKLLARCALSYFGVKDIDLHGHKTRLAPVVSSLTQLELYACGLVDDDVKDLISILPAGHDLEFLDVSSNSLSLAAVEALSGHLRCLPRLRWLTLNNIGLDPNIVKEVVGKNLPDMKETESGWFKK